MREAPREPLPPFRRTPPLAARPHRDSRPLSRPAGRRRPCGPSPVQSRTRETGEASRPPRGASCEDRTNVPGSLPLFAHVVTEERTNVYVAHRLRRVAVPINQDRLRKMADHGLTEYQARVYLTLLDLGSATASQISPLSKVPR